MTNLRNHWEQPSLFLEKFQCDINCVNDESKFLNTLYYPNYKFNKNFCITRFYRNFNVAILRDEGCNSDRELAASFYQAGFFVHDITMKDLMKTKNDLLLSYDGIAFSGGFSYSDVLGSGNGWYTNINNNSHLLNQFKKFYKHPEKFSIGICNGCQLMSRLGWIKGIKNEKIKLEKNISNRFESRFPTLKVKRSKSIFFKNMKKTCFGMWCAHGEGRFTMSDKSFKYLNRKGCLPLRYVDSNNKSTDVYPMNPNGSKMGVAAISSECGRHLAIMPHPERSFLKWQIPWISEKDKKTLLKTDYSPWFEMFVNCRKWMNSISVNFF